MSTTATVTSVSGRRPLSALAKLAIAALLAVAAVALLGQVVTSGKIEVNAYSLVPAVIVFVLAALVATGWRWAPAVAALLSGLLLLAMGLFTLDILARPHEPNFPVVILFLAFLLVATAAGLGAAVQNYRGGERRAPRWVTPALIGLSGVVLGAILVSRVPQQSTAAGVSPGVLAGLPVVTVEEFAFVQSELRVKAGETVALKLVNADSSGHTFDIDELDVHAPMPAQQSALALFRPETPGTFVFYCAIAGHADLEAGTGMVGTLIVEPAE